MQAARLSSEIAASSSGSAFTVGRPDADVDGLAGFPTTDPTGKPEQLSLDLGDEMSLFARVLTHPGPVAMSRAASPARVEVAEGAEAATKAAARADVSAQELQGLFRTKGWGR